jgi:Zn-dependent peptidase ImmA (M78 family)
MHELGHLALGYEGVSNLHLPSRPRSLAEKIEVFCNALAAEVLVPMGDLRSAYEERSHKGELDATIFSLSQRYAVSREVIARRLAEMGAISREVYEEKRNQYMREWQERAETQPGEFKIPYTRLVARDNGLAFTRMVLSAYSENLITGRDVSHLLRMKLKHLSRLQVMVFPNQLAHGIAE